MVFDVGASAKYTQTGEASTGEGFFLFFFLHFSSTALATAVRIALIARRVRPPLPLVDFRVELGYLPNSRFTPLCCSMQ